MLILSEVRGNCVKFICIFQKVWYINYDEGVHCGAQPGGIRPSSFLYNIKNLHEADFNRPKLSILLIL